MRPTASAAALLHACGYSFRPDVDAPSSPPSGEATRGTIFGLLAEQRLNGGLPVKLSEMLATLDVEEARKLVAMWGHASAWLDANAKVGWVAERAFAYDPATDVGRELPRTEHRDYDKHATAGEVCGTADIVHIEGEAVVLDDWKTTSPGAPEVNATEQLEWLALFVARAWGYSQACIRTLKVTEHGVEVIEGKPLDVFALDAIAERIAADVARIPGAEPAPGEHCKARYCKALAVCPATVALVAQVIPADALVRKNWEFSPTIQSPDHLAATLEALPVAQDFIDRVKKATVAYVADGPVQTSDGREVRQHFRTMTRTNQGALLELAKQLGATDEQLALCARTAQEPNGVRISSPKKGKAA